MDSTYYILIDDYREVELVLRVLYGLKHVWRSTRCQKYVPGKEIDYLKIDNHYISWGDFDKDYGMGMSKEEILENETITAITFLANNGVGIKDLLRKKLKVSMIL